MNITKADLSTYITDVERLECSNADENNVVILRYNPSQIDCQQLANAFHLASDVIQKHNPACSVIALPNSTSLETCNLAVLNSIADRIIEITKKQNV